MFEQGIVKEAEDMRKELPGLTASASLGYKEIAGYLDKEYSLDDARELLKKNTRRLAKKQMTWFRSDSRIRWIDLDAVSGKEALKSIIGDIKRQ